MATKTYIPGLRGLLKGIIKYIGQYLPKLGLNLTPEQLECVQDLLTAAVSCLALLGEREVE